MSGGWGQEPLATKETGVKRMGSGGVGHSGNWDQKGGVMRLEALTRLRSGG